MSTEWDWLADPREVVKERDPWMNRRVTVRRHLRALARAGELEGYCHRCGDCCHLSIKLPDPSGEDVRVLTSIPCKFLHRDEVGRAVCAVYEDRAQQAPWCNGTEDGMVAGLYTPACGYVRDADWYKGSTRIPSDLVRHLAPEIRECLKDPFDPEVLRQFHEDVRLPPDHPDDAELLSAIEHASGVADSQCDTGCAAEHRKLARWLLELRTLRSIPNHDGFVALAMRYADKGDKDGFELVVRLLCPEDREALCDLAERTVFAEGGSGATPAE